MGFQDRRTTIATQQLGAQCKKALLRCRDRAYTDLLSVSIPNDCRVESDESVSSLAFALLQIKQEAQSHGSQRQ